MNALLQFLAALVAIAIIHELGHWAMARLFGVKVLRVQIGGGYTVAEWEAFGTVWAIGWTLLGGYTTVQGMDQQGTKSTGPGDYRELHRFQQMLVILAGVLANLLGAMGIHAALAYRHGMDLLHAMLTGIMAPVQVLTDALLMWGTTLGLLHANAADNVPQFDGTLYAWAYCTATVSLLAGLLNLLPTKYTDGGRAVNLITRP